MPFIAQTGLWYTTWQTTYRYWSRSYSIVWKSLRLKGMSMMVGWNELKMLDWINFNWRSGVIIFHAIKEKKINFKILLPGKTRRLLLPPASWGPRLRPELVPACWRSGPSPPGGPGLRTPGGWTYLPAAEGTLTANCTLSAFVLQIQIRKKVKTIVTRSRFSNITLSKASYKF